MPEELSVKSAFFKVFYRVTSNDRFNKAFIVIGGLLVLGFLATGLSDGAAGLQKFTQFVVSGIGLGFIYAMIALGICHHL